MQEQDNQGLLSTYSGPSETKKNRKKNNYYTHMYTNQLTISAAAAWFPSACDAAARGLVDCEPSVSSDPDESLLP